MRTPPGRISKRTGGEVCIESSSREVVSLAGEGDTAVFVFSQGGAGENETRLDPSRDSSKTEEAKHREPDKFTPELQMSSKLSCPGILPLRPKSARRALPPLCPKSYRLLGERPPDFLLLLRRKISTVSPFSPGRFSTDERLRQGYRPRPPSRRRPPLLKSSLMSETAGI